MCSRIRPDLRLAKGPDVISRVRGPVRWGGRALLSPKPAIPITSYNIYYVNLDLPGLSQSVEVQGIFRAALPPFSICVPISVGSFNESQILEQPSAREVRIVNMCMEFRDAQSERRVDAPPDQSCPYAAAAHSGHDFEAFNKPSTVKIRRLPEPAHADD